MLFDRNENKEVIALLGADSMGTAIIRRIAAGASPNQAEQEHILNMVSSGAW